MECRPDGGEADVEFKVTEKLMKLRLCIMAMMVMMGVATVDAASVRQRYVPSAEAEWGGAPAAIEAGRIEAHPVKFIHYGGVIDISSEAVIDKIEVFALSGMKLSVKRVRGTSTTINAGDFDYGFYIVVTHFADGSRPAVNKFIR
ncbi:MAG: hypothetical protein J1E63_02230 [Muribaculaceae bacterium]|nr:hypothetical protein [Muribaculaceae bacterium]